jgi:hypothetical protein
MFRGTAGFRLKKQRLSEQGASSPVSAASQIGKFGVTQPMHTVFWRFGRLNC